MDVKDFHLKTRWFWLFLLGEWLVLAESWPECSCPVSIPTRSVTERVSSAVLDFCVNVPTIPGLRVGHLVSLQVGSETCAVAVRPPASRSPRLSPDSQWQHRVADSQYISWSPQGTSASAWHLAERLTLPHTALPHAFTHAVLWRPREGRKGETEAVDCVQFYLFF